MPRRPRSAPGGLVYHCLNRANGRATLFRTGADYAAFERCLAAACAAVPGVRLLAYCVMPNHWHLVLWPRADGELSRFMRLLTVTHAARWHAARRSAGAGHVYQGRFKSFPVHRDEHFLVLCRYVERNALRARLARRAQDWRWCSLWRRLHPDPRPPGEPGPGKAAPGGPGAGDAAPELPPLHEPWPVDRPADWVALVNGPQAPAEEAAVAESIARSRPLGPAAWTATTAGRLGLQWTLRPRGRPRKPPPAPAGTPAAPAGPRTRRTRPR